MSNNLRVPAPWSQFSVFIGMAGACLISFVLVAGFVYQVTGYGNAASTGSLLSDPRSIGIAKIVQVLFSLTVFGLTGYMYARITFREGPLYQLGLRPPSRNSFYLFAILLLLVAVPLESWLGELNKRLPLADWMIRSEKANDQQVEIFLKVNQPIDRIINVVVMAAIPAFCEELCFRGALQRIMIQICKRPLTGIVVSAFLFSFLHFQFEGFLPRMFLGILLGAAYWYSGSLWVAIIAHFFFNAAQIIAAMADPGMVSKSTSTPWLYVLISFAIVVGLLSMMRRRSSTTFADVYD
jgi:membrane protease YdiL (CAAX protease family)